ncbi:hypothetical protein CEXT_551931 [Caerostris extrusa]|uniref:Maturase K n=1 Tax=Caerostris extrusa TaxID=172846 RepID=A0AAV4U0Y9_CAEEX|nr:hypothetical protein CEXT_551931 [Caerostris extrusa]
MRVSPSVSTSSSVLRLNSTCFECFTFQSSPKHEDEECREWEGLFCADIMETLRCENLLRFVLKYRLYFDVTCPYPIFLDPSEKTLATRRISPYRLRLSATKVLGSLLESKHIVTVPPALLNG